MAVDVSVGDAVAVEVAVADAVAVSVAVTVAVGVGVAVAVSVAVSVAVAVIVAVSVAVGVGVSVSVAVAVAVGVSVGVAVGVSVAVAVGVGLGPVSGAVAIPTSFTDCLPLRLPWPLKISFPVCIVPEGLPAFVGLKLTAMLQAAFGGTAEPQLFEITLNGPLTDTD